MTLAIAHQEESRVVLDVLRECRPPFSPEDVVKEFSEQMKAYRISRVSGDRYGGDWPHDRFRTHGIRYDAVSKPKVTSTWSYYP